jgi:hypothetical protein
MCSTRPLGPLRVNRVVLTVDRRGPVYPGEQTWSAPVGMSQRCHEETCDKAMSHLFLLARADPLLLFAERRVGYPNLYPTETV